VALAEYNVTAPRKWKGQWKHWLIRIEIWYITFCLVFTIYSLHFHFYQSHSLPHITIAKALPSSPSISSNPTPHPIRHKFRRMAPHRILRRRRRKQGTSNRLRRQDTRFFFNYRCWGGCERFGDGTRSGADFGGQDLFEALGGGYCFDGFEILLSVSEIV
jgi:hypothetical protein